VFSQAAPGLPHCKVMQHCWIANLESAGAKKRPPDRVPSVRRPQRKSQVKLAQHFGCHQWDGVRSQPASAEACAIPGGCQPAKNTGNSPASGLFPEGKGAGSYLPQEFNRHHPPD